MAVPKYRFIAYAIARNNKDLIRVVVNQSDAVKAARDAKAHSVTFGESWLYLITDEKSQILVGHYINGQLAPTTPPKIVTEYLREKKNPGHGKAFTFHGSYTSKILAARKEKAVPGSFIEEREGRYFVLKPKKIASTTFYEPRQAKRNAATPKGAVKIYGRCLRIEAIKLRPHTYGGKPTASGQKYFHDFTTKNAMIYGLPDGSLLIKAK